MMRDDDLDEHDGIGSLAQCANLRCRKEFIRNSDTQRYCSERCRYTARAMRVAWNAQLEARCSLPWSLPECPYAAGLIKMPGGGRQPHQHWGF